MDNDANILSNIGTVFNKYMMPLNAPITDPKPVVGMQFDTQSEVQGRFARLSNINIKNLVINSGTASATGTFGTGASLSLSTTLRPNPPHQNDSNFALPYISIYQGTAALAGNQIFPRLGGSISTGVYNAWGNFDFESLRNNQPWSNWSGYIQNVSAGNQTILFVTQWKYLQYNQGSVT